MPYTYDLTSQKSSIASWRGQNNTGDMIKFTLNNTGTETIKVKTLTCCLARGKGRIRSADTYQDGKKIADGSYHTYSGTELVEASVGIGDINFDTVEIVNNIDVLVAEGGFNNSGGFKDMSTVEGGPQKYLVTFTVPSGSIAVAPGETSIFYVRKTSEGTGTGALSSKEVANCPAYITYYLKAGSPPIETLTAQFNPTLVGQNVTLTRARSTTNAAQGYQICKKVENSWTDWETYNPTWSDDNTTTYSNSTNNNIIAVQFRAYRTDDDYETSTSYSYSNIIYFKLNTPTLTVSPSPISIGETVSATSQSDDDVTGLSYVIDWTVTGKENEFVRSDSYTPQPSDHGKVHYAESYATSTYYNNKSGEASTDKNGYGLASNWTSHVTYTINYRPRNYTGNITFKCGSEDLSEGKIVIPTEKFSVSWDAFALSRHLGNFNSFKLILQDVEDTNTPTDIYSVEYGVTGNNLTPLSSGTYNDQTDLLNLIQNKKLTPGRNHRLVFKLCYRYGNGSSYQYVNDIADQENSNVFYSPTFTVAGFPEEPDFLYPIKYEDGHSAKTVNAAPQIIVKCKNPDYLTEDISKITGVSVRFNGRTPTGSIQPVNYFTTISYNSEGLPYFVNEDDVQFISVKKVQGTEIVVVIETGEISLFPNQKYWITVTCKNSFDLEKSSAVSLTYSNYENVKRDQIITAKSLSDLGNLCISYLNEYKLLTKELVENHPDEGRYFLPLEEEYKPDKYEESQFKNQFITSNTVRTTPPIPILSGTNSWLNWFLYKSDQYLGIYEIAKSYGVRRHEDDVVIKNSIKEISRGDIIYARDHEGLSNSMSPYYEGNIFNNIVDILKYML